MLDRFGLRPRFYFDADGGGGGGNPDDGGGNPNGGGGENPGGKTLTQEEFDRAITARLARERKAWEKTLEEEKAKAKMTEAEKLKAEKEEADKRAADVKTSADKRIINAESRIQAAAMGVSPERLSHVLKLTDLSAVEMGEDGEPDAKSIKAALEKVQKEVPELFSGEVRLNRGGNDFSGGSGGKGKSDMNAFIRRAAGR